MSSKDKILLHSCCACCASVGIKRLRENGLEPTLFYCDSNIYPSSEWYLRLRNLENLCNFYNVKFFYEPYDHEDWLCSIKGLEREPENGQRCFNCFDYRLSKTANFAKKNSFSLFSTTLTTSPHKNSMKIFEIGEKVAKIYNLSFVKFDFKKRGGFEDSVKISKMLNLYRQNYCGCEFSLANRHASPKE